MPNKIDLIRQALNAAESSIKLARQLMNDLDHSGGGSFKGKPHNTEKKPEHEQVPGVIGVFDGEQMTTDTGEKIAIPANYAAKSQIVVGDTLKMIEVEGEKRFKQVERVKRIKTTGVLTRKEGKYTVVAEEGRFRVLQNAVEHLGAKVGDEIMILVPEGNPNAGWAAAVSLPKTPAASGESAAAEDTPETPKEEKSVEVAKPAVDEKPKSEPKKVEAKEEPKPVKEKEVVATPVAAEPEPVVVEPVATPAPEVVAEVVETPEPEIPVEVAADMKDTLEEIASKTADATAVEPAPSEQPKKETPTAPIAPKAGEEVLVTDEDLM